MIENITPIDFEAVKEEINNAIDCFPYAEELVYHMNTTLVVSCERDYYNGNEIIVYDNARFSGMFDYIMSEFGYEIDEDFIEVPVIHSSDTGYVYGLEYTRNTCFIKYTKEDKVFMIMCPNILVVDY